jgi:UDP-3-O-[3-hydroxymyristoyl] glucosamine N-acyltransferase
MSMVCYTVGAMKRSLRNIAEAIAARLQGDGGIEIAGVASISSASAHDLTFVEDGKYLSAAQNSNAAALIAGEFAAGSDSKPLLIHKYPKLAFARAARLLRDQDQYGEFGRIDAVASLHASVTIAPNVTIEQQAVIADEVAIGSGTWIAAGCVIGRGVKIGETCKIYPRVTIYPGTTLGNRVIVHAGAVLGGDGFGYVRDPESSQYEKFPQIGRLVIEDDVEIGGNTTIDRGALDETRIGSGTKIDNLVHVGHNCRIGKNVVIAAQTGISGSAVIEDDVVIGGQVGIADHVRIERGVIVGAQAGIPSNKILRGKGLVFWGTPARPLHQYLRQLALLAKLEKKG